MQAKLAMIKYCVFILATSLNFAPFAGYMSIRMHIYPAQTVHITSVETNGH